MLLGIRIRNYSIFTDSKIGILPEDLAAFDEDPEVMMAAGITPAFAITNLTAFIGRNATGKSSFFDALSFLCDSTTLGCPQASTQKGRPGYGKLLSELGRPMEFECLFLLSKTNGDIVPGGVFISYQAVLNCDSYGRPFYQAEKVIRIRKDSLDLTESKTILDFSEGSGSVYCGGESVGGGVTDQRISALRSYGAIMSCPEIFALYREISHWYFCSFSGENPRRANGNIAPGGHRHLNATGSNIENVLSFYLAENPRDYHRMIEHISDKIPAVRSIANHLPASFRQSPDKLFLYLLLLADPTPRPLICIETPDMGLYHDMVDVLAVEFREYAMKYPFSQVMFTTHNPYILESLAPQEVWIFKRHDEAANKVDIACAGSVPIVAEMYRQGVGMGAIWYAGHFDE